MNYSTRVDGANVARNRAVGLRLALLAPGEIFGGAERQMLALCRHLETRDVDFRVLLFHDGQLASRLRDHHFDPIILRCQSPFSASAAIQLRRRLLLDQVNVLHLHGYKAAAHAWFATRFTKVSVVKTEHGAVETAHATLRERSKTAFYRSIDVFSTRGMDPEIVYVTRDLEQHFIKDHRGLARSVIYNGIEKDFAPVTRRPVEYDAAKRNVLLLGRLERVKGVEHAIAALRRPATPHDVVLHVVGDGPMRATLERLTQSLGVADRVLFHGFRSNAHDYTQHADALLMPSLHEGLPYVLLEAMSLRTPAIVSAVGGLSEVLENERTALLTEPGQPDSIAVALHKLFSNPELSQRISSEAFEAVRRSFSADRMGDDYLALYRRLANDAQRR